MKQNGHDLTFRMFWNIYILFILCVAAGIVSTEPCDDYTVISDNERAANLPLNITTTNPFTDDRLSDGWYRVQNDVGEEMATSPPGTFNCTTWSPIWLNGSLPTTINTTVTVPVCIQTFQSTCKYTWVIEIKRCPGNYLVYKLKTSPLIDSGYCFGWAVPCPAGQTGWSPNCKNTTTTSSTTVSLTTASSTTASMTMVRSTTVTTRNTGNAPTTDGSVRGGEQKEPCDDYTVISDNERAANLQLNITTTYPFTDDRLTDGWYRVQNDVGEDMATSPPGTFKCTTWSPIWLNGSPPSTINTTVTAPVCIQTFQSTCKYTWDIEIKRCPGNYLVYKLKPSPLIDSGYCFGWAVPCPVGQTGWSPNCKNATTTSSITVRSTTASSTTVTTGRSRGKVPTTDGSVRGGEKKGKEEEKTNVAFIVCAIFAVICVCLLFGIMIVMVRNKMRQTRCNTEKSEKRKNMYQEITKEYKYNKENDHLYSVLELAIYPEDSPPPYSSRRPSACSDVINSNGWTVEPQSPPVYLFAVGKK